MDTSVEPFVHEVQERVGDVVSTDPVVCAAYRYDASFRRGRATAVLLPRSEAEVAELLRLAYRHGVAITVRGAGSGLAGGAVPEGTVVLALSRLTGLSIDPLAMEAVAEAGVTTRRLQEAAWAEGLFYPPDPGSAAVSTIGGNLATNAGGSYTLRYGPTRHYVLGIHVVLADGTILRLGGRTSKNQSGYDLTNLFIGSEGTLGVITKARLRLLPRPDERTATVLAGFADLDRMGEAVLHLRRLPLPPTAIEFLDRHALAVLTDEERQNLPILPGGVLLIRQSWHAKVLPEAVEQTLAVVGGSAVSATYQGEAEARIWRMRESLSPAVARLKPIKISEDATVPVTELATFLKRLEAIRQRFHVDLLVFGHAGDGNLHPNLLAALDDPEEMARVEAAIDSIFQTAAELGGTLSGEHGVGSLKLPYLPLVHEEPVLAAMADVKRLFDPKGLLNPGKVLPR